MTQIRRGTASRLGLRRPIPVTHVVVGGILSEEGAARIRQALTEWAITASKLQATWEERMAAKAAARADDAKKLADEQFAAEKAERVRRARFADEDLSHSGSHPPRGGIVVSTFRMASRATYGAGDGRR